MPNEIIHLKNRQIDKKAWDECITLTEDGQPYALSWYLDIVSPNWEAFVIFDKNREYETVMPLPVKHQFRIPYLKQPFFCQQLGIFGNKVLEKEVLDSFLKKIKGSFSYVIDYTFHSGINQNHKLLSNSGMTQYLSLDKPYESTFRGYNRDRKLNLKRAFSSGLEICESKDIEPLVAIFKSYTSKKIYGGVSEEAYDILRRLVREFQARKMLRIFYTHVESGEFLTGGMFLIWKNKIIYLFNASTPKGKKKNGNTLILDHVIRTYSEQDYILDFESPSEEFGEITGFYGSFGSKKVILNELKYNNLPLFIKGIKNIRARIIKAVKR